MERQNGIWNGTKGRNKPYLTRKEKTTLVLTWSAEYSAVHKQRR